MTDFHLQRVSIHKKVLDFASKLNPVNKARLLTFFSSGGAQTRHIAQWLAHSLLIFNSVPLTVCTSFSRTNIPQLTRPG